MDTPRLNSTEDITQAQPPLLGVNIPWWGGSYSHDIGRNARYPDWPVWYNGQEVSRVLRWLSACGIRVVRLWLFEAAEGLQYDKRGRITGLDPVFHENLTDLVSRISSEGLKVYWSLLDANSVFRNDDAITYSILTNCDNARRFTTYALTPISRLIGKVAWGIDLCNEPEAIVTGESGNWSTRGASWALIQKPLLTLRDASAYLWPNIPISVGSGWHECRNLRSGIYKSLSLNLHFYDFHAQRHDIAYISGRANLAINANVVIGELGVGGNPSAPVSRIAWKAAQSVLANKLECVLRSSYQAVFLWYMPDWDARDYGGLVYRGETSPVLHRIAMLQNGIVPPLPFA